jgi:hypothetical protein
MIGITENGRGIAASMDTQSQMNFDMDNFSICNPDALDLSGQKRAVAFTKNIKACIKPENPFFVEDFSQELPYWLGEKVAENQI